MHFHKLHIHNIASIEDAVIDFDSQALASAEVFLITGRTGSGKSTILDAICLALYATTPRLDANRMQGAAAETGQTISLKDTRQLMRRNTGECYVTLTFRGSDGVEYEATWGVARAHRKPDRKLQGKTWTLRNCSTDVTLTKDREIEAAIRSAVGLDFKQFCRTTMLAQGEFTRFLNSADSEKAEILEKITGADIYSRISSKIYELTAARRAAFEDASRRVADVTLLTAEEADTLTGRQKAIDAELTALAHRQEEAAAIVQWHKRLAELRQRSADAATALNESINAINSDEFCRNEELLARWNDSAEVRASMLRRDQAANQAAAYRRDAEAQRGRFATLRRYADTLRHECTKEHDTLTALNAEIASERPNADIYASLSSISTHLRIINEAVSKSEKEATEAEKTSAIITNKLQPAASRAALACTEAEDAVKTIAAAQADLSRKFEQSGLKELRSRKESATHHRALAEIAAERLHALDDSRRSLESVTVGSSASEAELNKLTASLPSLSDKLLEARNSETAARNAYERQRDTVDKFARQMRSRLQPGDRCPVCYREIVEALPDDAQLDMLCEEARRQAEQATAERSMRESAVATCEAEINAARRQIAALSKQIEDAHRSVAEATGRAVDACHAINITALSTDTAETVSQIIHSDHAVIIAIEKEISAAEQIEAALAKVSRQLDKARSAATLSSQEREEADRLLLQHQTALERHIDNAKRYSDDAASARKEITEIIAGSLWENVFAANPAKFATNLAERAKRYEKSCHKFTQLELLLRQHTEQLSALDNVISEILRLRPEWTDIRLVATATDMTFTADDAYTLLSAISSTIELLRRSQEEIAECDAAIASYLMAHPDITLSSLSEIAALSADNIRILTDRLRTLREKAAAARSLSEALQKELTTHEASAMPDAMSAEEATEILESTDSRRNALMEERAAIKSRLTADNDARSRMDSLITARDAAREQWTEWERLNQMLGEKTGAKFRKIAQSYILSSLIDTANNYMRRLSNRYTLSILPGTFVINLTDAYQSYTTRSAATISGGESFLVSLALALALSDIGGRFASDILFIDEGFGSLSGEPLQNAIDTLRSLHSATGRRVGIISHVSELRECLPSQIRVERAARSSASSISIV